MVKPAGDYDDVERFERLFLPHLDSAYNLARWLTGNETHAQDVVQESCLRAFRALPGFKEDTPKAWLLTIVRNQCYTALKKLAMEKTFVDKVDFSALESMEILPEQNDNSETILIKLQDKLLLQQALDKLPAQFREVLVLRDFEDLSYGEIATISNAPIGTVMSRLSRARRLLKNILMEAHDDN